MIHFTIVIPVYNDWENLEILLKEVAAELKTGWSNSRVVVVDDFSLQPLPGFLKEYAGKVEVVELSRNLGHQKAIAVGLSYAVEKFPDSENFVVMDSDGEDKPADIPLLVAAIKKDKCNVGFAHRQKRNEAGLFQFGYKLYKYFFRVLTGQKISFGNFCVLSNEAAKRIVHVSEIWLHFSSGVIKSRIPYETIPTVRGKRYLGKSKMNFANLISHGLSAIAVYSEIVAVRITLISVLLSFLSLAGIVVVFAIKQLTIWAIPGWTSFVSLGLLILIAQFFSLGILLAFVVLSSKTIKNVNPSLIYREYIYKLHII